ncbi:MAG TPA: MBL fold metallo-hydrolase [Gammaproteobacteria bacterium]
MRTIGRREFLLAAGSAYAALTGLAAFPRVARGQGTGLAFTELRPGLWQVSGAGGNVLLLRTPDGIAMVDSGAPEHTAALRAAMKERLGDAPVALLFNTHWHLDHAGGNDPFGAAGTTIVAHMNTRLWMSTEFYVDWEDKTYPPRSPEALPTRTFYSSDPQPIELELGGEPIEYGHLDGAHTDGDIYVFFRRLNVIAAGGAVAVGRYPVPDTATGGWIGGTAASTAKLLALADDDTLVVPGHGPAQRRPHLEAQHEMLTTVQRRMEEGMRKGLSAEDMVAEGLTAEFDAKWGNNRDRFVSNVYDGLWWGGRLSGAI